MAPVLTVVGEIGESISATKPSQADGTLRIGGLKPGAFPVEDDGSVQQSAIHDQSEPAKHGLQLPASRRFQSPRTERVVNGELDFRLIKVGHCHALDDRLVFPAARPA